MAVLLPWLQQGQGGDPASTCVFLQMHLPAMYCLGDEQESVPALARQLAYDVLKPPLEAQGIPPLLPSQTALVDPTMTVLEQPDSEQGPWQLSTNLVIQVLRLHTVGDHMS